MPYRPCMVFFLTPEGGFVSATGALFDESEGVLHINQETMLTPCERATIDGAVEAIIDSIHERAIDPNCVAIPGVQ